MTDPTPYDQDVPDHDALDDASALAVGDFVKVTWLDTLTGDDVVNVGHVVEVLDQETGPAVRVALNGQVTGPLPLDHEVHLRVDAPRVELAEPWEVIGAVTLDPRA